MTLHYFTFITLILAIDAAVLKVNLLGEHDLKKEELIPLLPKNISKTFPRIRRDLEGSGLYEITNIPDEHVSKMMARMENLSNLTSVTESREVNESDKEGDGSGEATSDIVEGSGSAHRDVTPQFSSSFVEGIALLKDLVSTGPSDVTKSSEDLTDDNDHNNSLSPLEGERIMKETGSESRNVVTETPIQRKIPEIKAEEEITTTSVPDVATPVEAEISETVTTSITVDANAIEEDSSDHKDTDVTINDVNENEREEEKKEISEHDDERVNNIVEKVDDEVIKLHQSEVFNETEPTEETTTIITTTEYEEIYSSTTMEATTMFAIDDNDITTEEITSTTETSVTTTETSETTTETSVTTTETSETTTETSETTAESTVETTSLWEVSTTEELTTTTTTTTIEEMAESESSTTDLIHEETTEASELTTTEEIPLTTSEISTIIIPENEVSFTDQATTTMPDNTFSLNTHLIGASAVENPEEVLLSSTEPKRLGAYIVVSLILISFLALVGYIVFRNRIRRREINKESNVGSDEGKEIEVEKALLSLNDYKDSPEGGEMKNNEIDPSFLKQNKIKPNNLEKNTNFSSCPKNLNINSNEKHVNKDNNISSLKNPPVSELSDVILEVEDVPQKQNGIEKPAQNTEKHVVKTHLDEDSIPKRAILIDRNSGTITGFIPITTENMI